MKVKSNCKIAYIKFQFLLEMCTVAKLFSAFVFRLYLNTCTSLNTATLLVLERLTVAKVPVMFLLSSPLSVFLNVLEAC